MIALLVAGSLVVSFTITGKSIHKPFTPAQYFYAPSSGKTYIGTGQSTSIVESEIKSASKWNASAQPAAQSNFLCLIEFVEEVFDEDGGNDGELTKQEAINEVWSYYATHSNTLPSNGGFIIVGTAVIQVYRRGCL